LHDPHAARAAGAAAASRGFYARAAALTAGAAYGAQDLAGDALTLVDNYIQDRGAGQIAYDLAKLTPFLGSGMALGEGINACIDGR
jgi:hypothetical protein